ncbi:MAG: SagB/ThcOx family dehydrogenase [Pseudomonadota bacterium]
MDRIIRAVCARLGILLLIFLAWTASHAAPADDVGRVQLPAARLDGGMSVERALAERHSVRDCAPAPLSLAEAAQLLWAAQGRNEAGGRTAPSAGALYPLELYLVAGRVRDLPPGVYRYLSRDHALAKVRDGDRRAALAAAALGQAAVAGSAMVLVLAADYARTTRKYGQRGQRYVHLEAGHAAQNVYLQAAALRLGTVAVGAFDDDRVRRVLGLPAAEEPLYLLPVGRLR